MSRSGRSFEFWYEFGSPYSYPAAFTVSRLDLPVRSIPFLLGPLFKAQGWHTSPFNIYPAKGRYMWRDIERICLKVGLPFTRPSVFPRGGLLAARVALTMPESVRIAFSQRVFSANFAEDREISDPVVIAEILDGMGLPSREVLDRAQTQAIKDELRDHTARAVDLGIFGAPMFRVDAELFWGNDRLPDAVDWWSREG